MIVIRKLIIKFKVQISKFKVSKNARSKIFIKGTASAANLR